MRGDELSPVVRYVRGLGDYYLVAEVAEVLGQPERRLRTLQSVPDCAPSATAPWAGGIVHLYTEDDVHRIKQYLESQPYRRDGTSWARTLWTVEEYHDRQRRERRVRYYRQRAEVLRERGEPAAAVDMRRKANRIADELQAERDARWGEVRFSGSGPGTRAGAAAESPR